MERICGYVVGRKSAYGISTWAVRVQQKGHTLDGQKLLVASIAKGVTLSKGLDVDFFVGNRGGQTMATDVAPKGVASEGNRQMNRKLRSMLIAVMVVIITVMAAFVVVYKPWQWKEFRDQMLEMRLERVVDRLSVMAFPDMVTDAIVRQAVNNYGRGDHGYSSREAVFDEYICPPFGDKHSYYLISGSKCWRAIYDAKTGSPVRFLEGDGFPGVIGPLVKKARELAIEKARAYLAEPEQLWSFYMLRKPTALEAIEALDAERRKEIDSSLRKFRNSLLTYLTSNAVKEALVANLAAEERWMSAKWGTPERDVAWDEMQVSQTRLYEMDGTSFIKFAGRRYAEGGEDLVLTYIRIADDMLANLK